MKDLPLLIVNEIVDNDLRIVMVARVQGADWISSLITIKGGAVDRSGNPYIVFGKHVEEFTGRNRFSTSITVADCRSGDLEKWATR